MNRAYKIFALTLFLNQADNSIATASQSNMPPKPLPKARFDVPQHAAQQPRQTPNIDRNPGQGLVERPAPPVIVPAGRPEPRIN